MFLKIPQYSQENTVLESLFNEVAGLKVLSCEYCKIFRKTCFEEHLWTAASISYVYHLRRFTKTIIKACVRYFSLFLQDKCISLLFRTNYIQKKFNLKLFFLPTASRTSILSRATTRYPPPRNFLFRKNNCMCDRDNVRDAAACPDE